MAHLGSFGAAAKQADPNREPDTFDLYGETFTVADKIGIIPLALFAKAASSGLDSAEMDGLAAMVDLLTQVVVDEDRNRFLETASKNRADGDDLMPIVQAVIEAQSGNPTQPASDSSPGPSTTGPSSRESSPSDADLSPIQRDPRVRELRPLADAAVELLG